jgi:hypothetical protein
LLISQLFLRVKYLVEKEAWIVYHSGMMTEKKSKRTLLFKMLAPILTVFFTLFLLEGGLRLLELVQKEKTIQEQMTEMPKEAGQLYPPPGKLFSLVLERESLGHKNHSSMGLSLRDYDYPVEKPPNTYRIIGLGDSFAWGWGVADNRRTTFKYLECWLNETGDGKSYEVINCAQPAKTVNYYESFVKEYGEKFQPDMFLILYNLNDSYLPHASMVVDRRTEKLMQDEKDPLSDISRLYRLVKKRIVKKRVHDYTVGHIKEGYFGPEKEQKWGKAQENLKEIQRFCQEHGIELVVAIFPLLFELEKNYPFQNEVEEMERFLKSSQIKSVNLLPSFIGKKTFVLWSRPTDSHPNRIAHRIAAETIFRYLKQNVLSTGS